MKKYIYIQLILMSALSATTINQSIDSILKNNPEIKSFNNNYNSIKELIDKEKGGYLPKINLNITGEKKDVTKEVTNIKTKTKHNGYDAEISLNQLIYDGGLTFGKINASKIQTNITAINNSIKEDNLIFEGIKVHLDIVKYQKRLNLTKEYIKLIKNYLKTAKSNELLSDDSLDTYEVKSKLFITNKNYLDEQDNLNNSINNYKKLTLTDINDEAKSPKIDETLISSNLPDLLQETLKNNKYIILKKHQLSKQNEIIDQVTSKYLPTIKASASSSVNDDLITKDTKINTNSLKLSLNYNLFNGGSDLALNKKESYSKKEIQNGSIDITNKIIETLNTKFTTYNLTKNKINELKKYILSNEKILELYKYKFKGGEKTFVDILTKESDLYSSKIELINEKYLLKEAYYNILLITSKLKTALINN